MVKGCSNKTKYSLHSKMEEALLCISNFASYGPTSSLTMCKQNSDPKQKQGPSSNFNSVALQQDTDLQIKLPHNCLLITLLHQTHVLHPSNIFKKNQLIWFSYSKNWLSCRTTVPSALRIKHYYFNLIKFG